MLDYINEIRNTLKQFAPILSKQEINERRNFLLGFYNGWINIGIEHDLMYYNYSDLMSTYVDYFKGKNLKTITLTTDTEYYRARIGSKGLKVKFDDIDLTLNIPYYNKDISQVPPLLATGGRFNREGVSYLYLANDVETALAEVHSQVGQLVTVAKFKLFSDLELLDLSCYYNDIELDAWKYIMVQPIHEGIKKRYLITQFLSDVLRHINGNGFYFKSSQTDGYNIVCFKPYIFYEIDLSEELYQIAEISYKFYKYQGHINKDTYQNIESYLGPMKTTAKTNMDDFNYFTNYMKHKNDVHD